MTAPDWANFDVVCIASGPSVTREDCEKVRRWRDAAPQRAAVVVNSMFTWCPWADVMFALDRVFWDEYRAQAALEFAGRRYTHGPNLYDVEDSGGRRFSNSGAAAIELAHVAGAKRIILLGYDMGPVNGVTHCHGDHPEGMGVNTANCSEWPQYFRWLKDHLPARVQVVNATPNSPLRHWPLSTIDEALL